MTAELSVIEVREVRKSFGSAVALDGVDLVVPPGQVHGFLGPNGAGKSTTIRILLGLLRADGGSAAVFGRDAWAEAVQIHRRLAYVPGDVSLWPNLSGGEAIDLLTRLHGTVDRARRADMLERFELDPTKRIKTYSKGNRQKVALVAALSSAADLYILDEPTSGLDPLMEAVFRRSVVELRDAGATILLSSHILAEVEVLCDQLSIIRQGRIVESGSLADLRHLSRIEVRAQTRDAATGLADQPGVHDVVVDGAELRCHVDGPELQRFLEALTGLGVVSLTCQPPTLEELFLRHYGDPVQDSADDGTADVPSRTANTPGRR